MNNRQRAAEYAALFEHYGEKWRDGAPLDADAIHPTQDRAWIAGYVLARDAERNRWRKRRCLRPPYLEEMAEGGWIVRHTEDVELAAHMLHVLLEREERYDVPGEAALHWPASAARVVWRRITPALPNSWAAAEGYHFAYTDAKPHTRGAFPAVEWWA